MKKFCSVLWLYSPYGTFTRGCTNKLNFFPSIVNAGHAVMGHKAALKKNPACHFLLMHLFLVPFSMSICLECFCLVFHQGQENLINSERWRKEDKNRARMPQGQLQVKDVYIVILRDRYKVQIPFESFTLTWNEGIFLIWHAFWPYLYLNHITIVFYTITF